VRSDHGQTQAGFTLVELAIIMAGFLTLASMAVPEINNVLQSQRAGTAARQVERELQSARLKAVSTSRALRVKFNCPATGQYRMLEVTGVSTTDSAGNRCSASAYPFPGPNDILRSTPKLDSPVQSLPADTTVSATSLDIAFGADGNAYTYASGTATPLVADLVLTVTRAGYSKTVTINALGRVKLN
jgi:Tfp pilus assembly protein FimT